MLTKKFEHIGPIENEINSNKKASNLLSDSYLPVLRSFATTQRVHVPPTEEVVSNFKKSMANDSKNSHKPKVI